VKFEFIHCALQPEEQAIVRQARIVDSFRVNDDCSHNSAQLDQVMPIPAIPREPGSLDRQNSPYMAGTNLRD
jgi:hypothetical protein